MKLINAIKNLKAYHIVEFRAGQPDTTNVDIVSDKTDCLFNCKMCELEDFFKRDDVEQAFTDDNDIISFISPETTLQIAGVDYKWHIATVRNTKYKRLEKLFHPDTTEAIKQPKEKTGRTQKFYTIQCCEFDENNNKVADEYIIQGTRTEFVGGINHDYSMIALKSRFTHILKFRFSDDEEWQTMEQLIEKGVFTE